MQSWQHFWDTLWQGWLNSIADGRRGGETNMSNQPHPCSCTPPAVSILDCHVCKGARKDNLTREHIVYLLYGWCTHTRYHTCPNTFEPKISEHLVCVSALWHGSLGRGVLRPCVAHTWAQARSHTTEASAAWPFWQIMIQTNNKVIEICAVCFWVVSGISCSSHIINRLWLMSKSVQS